MHGNPGGIGDSSLVLGAGVAGVGRPGGDLPPIFTPLSISVGFALVLTCRAIEVW